MAHMAERERSAPAPPEQTGNHFRRAIVVGRHGDPRRINIRQLEVVVRKLREASDAVAADLGVSRDEVGDIALVELINGSCGAVFEQESFRDQPSSLIPLVVTIDSAKSYAQGKGLPSILTEKSVSSIVDLVKEYKFASTDAAPISIAESETIYAESDAGQPVTIVRALIELPALSQAEEKQKQDAEKKETDKKEDERLTEPSQWLITISGLLQRLDAKKKKMWISTSSFGLVGAKLNDSLFEAADADKSRWKTVTVICLASEPTGKGVRDSNVLHVGPAQDGAPEYKAIPMTEAAQGIGSVLERIDSFGKLTAGWDSYKASVIGAGARKAARGFLVLAASAMRARGHSFRIPFAAPLPSGGIQLEWETGPLCLEIEIANDGSLSFLRGHEDDFAEGPTTRDGALGMVEWFHARSMS